LTRGGAGGAVHHEKIKRAVLGFGPRGFPSLVKLSRLISGGGVYAKSEGKGAKLTCRKRVNHLHARAQKKKKKLSMQRGEKLAPPDDLRQG